MDAAAPSDKELFRHLGLLSNEVIQIQKTIGTIDSQEARLRAALDELALEKDILIEQMNRLESIVKEAATSAVEDDQRERERQQSLEEEKAALQNQIEEMEATLQTKNTAANQLQKEFTAKLEELNEQIKDKESLLQFRNIALSDLRTAARSLNRLVNGLSTKGEAPGAADDPQNKPTGETADAIKAIEERASMEIELERLRNDVREKELAIAAKSVELEMTKQKMNGRIEELERALDTKVKRKSPRLVALLSDMGGKKFV